MIKVEGGGRWECGQDNNTSIKSFGYPHLDRTSEQGFELHGISVRRFGGRHRNSWSRLGSCYQCIASKMPKRNYWSVMAFSWKRLKTYRRYQWLNKREGRVTQKAELLQGMKSIWFIQSFWLEKLLIDSGVFVNSWHLSKVEDSLDIDADAVLVENLSLWFTIDQNGNHPLETLLRDMVRPLYVQCSSCGCGLCYSFSTCSQSSCGGYLPLKSM